MRKLYFFIITSILLSICTISICDEKHNYKPPEGYVPDATTAIRIAVAVWEPIYGKKEIKKQAPYNAELNNGVWRATGTLKQPRNSTRIDKETGWEIMTVVNGGVALIEIEKESGCILRVSHGE